MKDLDFDEIDKAVTSAMGSGSGTPDAPKSVEVSEVIEAPSVQEAPADPQLPMEIPEDLPAVIQKPLPPAVRRTTGRVMDIMPRGNGAQGAQKAPRPSADSYHAPTAIPRNKDLLSSVFDDPAEEVAATPFLPDANNKVEKRPLGQFGQSGISDIPPVEESLAAVPELGSADQPIGDNTPLPAELTEDLLSLEDTTPTPETPPVAGDSPEVIPEVVVAQESNAVPDVAPSIVQQYQEKQASNQTESGAIYDTEAYHAPMKAPVKKRGVLWVILWVLGLIVVGAGIGWAVYTFVLPML